MKQFEQVIHEMIEVFDQFLPLEQEKLKAVSENNLTVLEDCMNQEQAVVLKLRGLEKKREDAQKQLGWAGKTFREIIELVPDEKQVEYRQLFEQLTNSMNMFQEANESALDTITVNLRRIDNTLKRKDPQGTTYSQDGTIQENKPLTNRRV